MHITLVHTIVSDGLTVEGNKFKENMNSCVGWISGIHCCALLESKTIIDGAKKTKSCIVVGGLHCDEQTEMKWICQVEIPIFFFFYFDSLDNFFGNCICDYHNRLVPKLFFTRIKGNEIIFLSRDSDVKLLQELSDSYVLEC